MPSEFEQLATISLASIYASFGVAAKYVSPDGTEKTIGDDGNTLTIRVQGDDFRQVERASRANGEVQTGVVFVLQSQVAKPVRGGRFIIDTVEVWTIDTTPRLRNGEHICTCSRSGVERLMERRAKE